MKIIIIIEMNTQNIQEYLVRTRADAFSVSHVKQAGGFTTIEDAQEYAEVLQKGMEIAGADTKLVLAEELEDELDSLPIYLREMRIFNFNVVWEKL